MKIYRFLIAIWAVGLNHSSQASEISKEDQKVDSTAIRKAGQQLATAAKELSSAIEDSSNTTSSTVPWGASFVNLKYRIWSDPEVEKTKFPQLCLSQLISHIDDQTNLKFYTFSYTTGSKEGASDHYKGYAKIFNIEFWTLNHTFTSFDKGFNPNVTCSKPSKNKTFKQFAQKLIDKSDDAVFHKGIPYKNDQGKTECVYYAHNKKGTKRIQFIIERTPVK